ncbi:MAG: PAS domain S-box protein [Desulfovibrionales bacterium]
MKSQTSKVPGDGAERRPDAFSDVPPSEVHSLTTKSLEGFEAIVQNSPDIIVRMDRRGTRLFVNRAIETYTGKHPSTFIGKSIEDSFQPDLSRLFRTKLDETFRTGKKVCFEFSSPSLLGFRSFQTYVVPEFQRDGTFTTVLSVSRDVTEQKQVEEALRASEENFRELTENIQDVIWLQTTEEILYVNPAYESVWGRSISELYERPGSFLDAVHPEDRERIAQAHARHTHSGKSFAEEYRILLPDGEVRWIDSRVFPIFREGKVVRLAGIAEDITRYKEIEEELRTKELQYRTLVETSPDIVVRYDRKYRRLFVSPAVAELFGKSQEEMIGRTIGEENLAPDTVPILEKGIEQVFKTGTKATIEIDFQKPHGRIWHQFKLIPEFSAEGDVVSVLGVGRDVTDLKLVQMELQLAHDALEYRIKRRTDELERTNFQLMQEVAERELAEEAARQASQAKSEFLASMSHEIRTPISGIKGLSEMMLHREKDSEKREELAMIIKAAGSLTSIINDLLDLSRIESGKMELVWEDFDLHALLGRCVKIFQLPGQEKGVFLSLSQSSDLPQFVRGDAGKLEQVLKNLLFNAVKFTEQGEVELTVTPMGEAGELLFSVRDTGIGIPADRIDDLFKSFSQLDPSLSKKYGGAGLGLAISKRLVELMGGTIWVESTEGKGSRFFFSIKLPASTVNVDMIAQGNLSGPELLALLPKLSILLAEDNKVNTLFLTKVLSQAGHCVVSVENGREALEVFETDTYDLVLMDIQMPEMDGLQATRAIRKKERTLQGNKATLVPIIALTAYAMKGDREKFLQAGMDGYVSKPVDFAKLARTIFEVLDKRIGA